MNPTSILTGCLAVTVGAFLAAVYLAADAARLGEPDLQRAFRMRALLAGVVAGGVALAGLPVLAHDARHVYHGLTSGYGLAAVVVSGLAGIGTLALVWLSRFQLAWLSAAVAVAAIVAGWAAAQRPTVLPRLTLHDAAASRATLVAVIVAVVAGGLILAPSLGLLFRLVLTGGFDPRARPAPPPAGRTPRYGGAGVGSARLALTCLVTGFLLLTVLENGVAHGFGVVALLAAATLAFRAVGPADLDDTVSPLRGPPG